MAVSAPVPSDRTGEPLLRVKGVNKAFGAVQALRNVDFEIYAGEIVGLVGDNGAGKSTLVKIISGAYTADSGAIYIAGQQVRLTKPYDAKQLGIETVYQDLALCDNLDVVENLFLGRELQVHTLNVLDQVKMERRALEVLKVLDIHLPSVRVPVAALTGGQRQSVAVAKALLRNAKIVLLDEPTAALGYTQTRQVLDLIKRLRSQGVAIVIISHNLADVFDVVDRMVVLRLGKRVATFDVKFATADHVAATILGEDVAEHHASFPPSPLNGKTRT